VYSLVNSQTIDLGFPKDLKCFVLLPSCPNSHNRMIMSRWLEIRVEVSKILFKKADIRATEQRLQEYSRVLYL